MATLSIYLNFNGNCREAFEFYKSVFGGEFARVATFGEMPGADIPEDAKSRIMHISLPVADSVLMGSDTMEGMGKTFQQGNNFAISYTPKSREDTDKTFAALSKGGTVFMPLADQFWGDYFGQLTDRFGVTWMLNLPLNR